MLVTCPNAESPKRGIRKAESRRVRKVEELAANLDLHVFVKRKLFADRKVGVMNSVAAQSIEIARGVPGNLVAGIGKTAGIEDRRGIWIEVCAEGDVLSIGGSLVIAEA